jgi:hypothetical protein
MQGLKFRSLKYASIMINYATVLVLIISNTKMNGNAKAKIHAGHLFIRLYPPVVYLIYIAR